LTDDYKHKAPGTPHQNPPENPEILAKRPPRKNYKAKITPKTKEEKAGKKWFGGGLKIGPGGLVSYNPS
jgi:hypothetical protein